MEHGYGQCSSNTAGSGEEDNVVMLASSCPKKRAGRKKFKETRHPVYRGVRQRNGNRWVCEVRTPNNNARIWLGTYPTAEMAARAHDVAALALRGRLACLNFADSAWRLPTPASNDTADIQRAAAEAAESFRPPELPLQVNDENSNNNNNNNNSERGEKNGDEDGVYMDEEAVFDMPGLLANMAEGLCLPPPHNAWDEAETTSDYEVSLWNY